MTCFVRLSVTVKIAVETAFLGRTSLLLLEPHYTLGGAFTESSSLVLLTPLPRI